MRQSVVNTEDGSNMDVFAFKSVLSNFFPKSFWSIFIQYARLNRGLLVAGGDQVLGAALRARDVWISFFSI